VPNATRVDLISAGAADFLLTSSIRGDSKINFRQHRPTVFSALCLYGNTGQAPHSTPDNPQRRFAMRVAGQSRRFDLTASYSGLPRTTAPWSGSCHKRPCMNRTGTNEATNRHYLPAQRFTAVGALIASGALWCVAGISAPWRGTLSMLFGEFSLPRGCGRIRALTA
jgi:hypothetical protein